MNHEKDLRRFLYLGPTRHRRKDMLLAFPLRLRAPRSKERILRLWLLNHQTKWSAMASLKLRSQRSLLKAFTKGDIHQTTLSLVTF